jgi:GNAT superfamily N-acetyltransferase
VRTRGVARGRYSRPVIRRAGADDLPAIGRVFLAARDEMTYLPRVPDEDRPRIGTLITRDRDELWVAEQDGEVTGFTALRDDELAHLYVDPAWQGRGLGTELFDQAKRERPNGFRFWVFQKNDGARRFYERHGCRMVKLTDGADNMEHEPDALYEWAA